jgi:hypothetical protein
VRRLAFALGLAIATASVVSAQDVQQKPVSFVGLPLATDSTYGYTSENPIKVGGFKQGRNNQNQLLYLDQLRGPNGEKVEFVRLGSCCFYDTPNGIMGRGLLDRYQLTYPGLEEPIVLYLSLYDYEAPKIPVGFSAATP